MAEIVGVQVAPDHESVMLSIGHAQISLSAPDVERVTLELMQERSKLNERVRDSVDPHSVIQGVHNPSWLVSNDPGDTKLLIRHPGFGWMAFVLPEQSIKLLHARISSRLAGDR